MRFKMKNLFTRSLRICSAVLLSTLAISGCTFNFGSNDSDRHMGMMGDDRDNSSFSTSDVMFAQMMIPHHQQAVDMGTLAESRSVNSEVKELAAKIKAEQAPEINQMKSWLDAANAPLIMDHEMDMGGMLSDSEFNALENANAAEFDKLFLEKMILHHQGAIQMAQMVVNSNNSEVRDLGNAIITSQTEQITYMESLLAKYFN